MRVLSGELVATMQKRLTALDDVTAVAVTPGNADADDYMRGMANGLILAQAIMQGTAPQYICGSLKREVFNTGLTDAIAAATGDKPSR